MEPGSTVYASLSSLLSTSPSLTDLQLGNNALGDSGVRRLCEGLRHPDCRIQKLGLIECSLTGACVGDLVSTLSQAVTELDLSGNDLEDSGMRRLCEGLKHPACKIQKLDVSACCLAGSFCADLAAVLCASRSLTELDLSGTALGETGVRELCGGLKHPDSKLQKLQMKCCSITAACCADLSAVLCTNPCLTELDLSDNKLEDSGMRALCEGLAHPGCRLQKLEMWRCSLTGASCADLSSLLSKNTSLSEIILNDNELGDSGVRQLCEGLKHPGCKLQKLEMTGCSLTAACCAHLSSVLSTSQTLTALILSDNELGDSGATLLWEGLKHPSCTLQTLLLEDIRLTGSSCADIASVLHTNESLTELDLSGNDLEDSGVTRLCEGLKQAGCNIQKLDLGSCSLTGSCCADLSSVLCTCPALTELVLTGNKLGDSGVRQLCEGLKNPGCKIQNLQISTCSLTGSCCEDLASVLRTNQYLRLLDLSNNELRDSGVRQLCEGLKHPGCTLQKLEMWRCSFTGACCADIASALSVNQSLRELELSGNVLGEAGGRQLCVGLRHPGGRIQKLSLMDCSLSASCCGDVSSVSGTGRSPVELERSGTSVPEDSEARPLCEERTHPGSKTHEPEMSEGSPTASAGGDLTPALCMHSTLTELVLSDNELGDSGLRHLCEALKDPDCKLQKLELNDCKLTSACLGVLSSVLSTHHSLTQLELSDNTLDDSGVSLLCEGLKYPGCIVQKLGICNCSLTGSCWADLSSLLSTNTTLTELDLGENGMGDSGVKQLCEGLKHPGCKIQKLEVTHSSLTGNCCEDLASVLRSNTSLIELHLNSNALGDSGIKQLCEGLRHPACTIQKLKMINCSLTDACCEHLFSALSTNQSLAELHLGFNELGDAGMKQLCNVLKSPSCKLQTLGLLGCSLTGSCCADLASVFWIHSSLTELDLGENELGDSGLRQLREGLIRPGCKVLKLDITNCSLTSACCAGLSSVLSMNQSLREIILTGNKLMDSGVRELCEGLKHPDCRIQKLWLDNCSLTASCCDDLASALSANPSLAYLHLADNELGDRGAQRIFAELKHPDCKIQRLWMWHCSLTESCCKDLASVLSVNQSLTELELCGNELGDAGVKLLCEGLKHPGCKMQNIGLGSCSLTGACCADLASVLSINQSLTELDLSDNEVGDLGVSQLCEGFKHHNCKIPRLRLWGCSLTDACCADISSVLSNNQSLTELILSYNKLGDSGVRQLCEGLRHPGCKIQKLELWHCSLTASCCEDLSSLLCTSQPLSELDVTDNEQGVSGV